MLTGRRTTKAKFRVVFVWHFSRFATNAIRHTFTISSRFVKNATPKMPTGYIQTRAFQLVLSGEPFFPGLLPNMRKLPWQNPTSNPKT